MALHATQSDPSSSLSARLLPARGAGPARNLDQSLTKQQQPRHNFSMTTHWLFHHFIQTLRICPSLFCSRQVYWVLPWVPIQQSGPLHRRWTASRNRLETRRSFDWPVSPRVSELMLPYTPNLNTSMPEAVSRTALRSEWLRRPREPVESSLVTPWLSLPAVIRTYSQILQSFSMYEEILSMWMKIQWYWTCAGCSCQR